MNRRWLIKQFGLEREGGTSRLTEFRIQQHNRSYYRDTDALKNNETVQTNLFMSSHTRAGILDAPEPFTEPIYVLLTGKSIQNKCRTPALDILQSLTRIQPPAATILTEELCVERVEASAGTVDPQQLTQCPQRTLDWFWIE